MAAAGLALAAPGRVKAQASGGVDDLHIALIGLGAQGRVLLDAMLNIPGLHFQAVCDIWDYSRTYGVRKIHKETGTPPAEYENYEDLLEKEKGLDAVVIATPDFWHAPQTVDCLNAGLHVYCEKMMSNTQDGARSMAKAMKETGKLCQIGHHRRSNPRYLHVVYNLIRKANLCGRIVNCNGQWNRAVTEDIGWPKKYAMPEEKLKQYGFENMHQFRNWRWFKGLGGGPISDLGAHQIDIFNWFLGTPPKTVQASGGRDYYSTREHFDNVMSIFEYETPEGVTRAFYQTLTATSAGGGYFERFMGDEGTIKMSENPALTKVYREERAKDWQEYVDRHYLRQDVAALATQRTAKVDVRETAPLLTYDIPIVLDKPIHQPHLENFFAAVREQSELNCDAVHAYESEVCIFKVNPAAETQTLIELKPEDFVI